MNYEQMASKLNDFNTKNLQSVMALTEKSLDRTHKLAEINFETTKSLIGEVTETVQSAMTAKDPQALMSIAQDGALDQYAGKLFAHQQAVSKVVREAGEEMTTMAETAVEQYKVSLKEWISTLSANAPAGSEAMIGAMKTALDTTLNGMGQVQAAVKEAAATAEQNAEQAFKTMQGQVATVKKAATAATKTARTTARK